jgi:hypothetical protein
MVDDLLALRSCMDLKRTIIGMTAELQHLPKHRFLLHRLWLLFGGACVLQDIRDISAIEGDPENCSNDVIDVWEKQMDYFSSHSFWDEMLTTCDDPCDYQKIGHWNRFLREEWTARAKMLAKNLPQDVNAYTELILDGRYPEWYHNVLHATRHSVEDSGANRW